MTQKELMLNLLIDLGTTRTKELGDLSGLSCKLCHNALKALFRDGMVTYDKKGLDVYWSPVFDDLEPKQTWVEYVPPKIRHNHHLMNCWYA